MARFYELREDRSPRYSGFTSAVSSWRLPGMSCPVCGGVRVAVGNVYPCVDLSALPEREAFREPRPESIEEFERLREQVRPLAPPGALLLPGARFGPLVGTASGSFGSFFHDAPFTLLVRREALEQLQGEGLRGLLGCPAQLRFRQKKAPELWELQLEHRGRLHPACLPPHEPPCPRCGSESYTLPQQLMLDVASLPTDLDLFRLVDATAIVIGSERFVEAARRLQLDGVTFHELPLSEGAQRSG